MLHAHAAEIDELIKFKMINESEFFKNIKICTVSYLLKKVQDEFVVNR